MLQATNAQLRAILPLVDLHLSPVAAWSQGALLSRARALMLAKLKQPFWLAGLRATRKTTAKKFDLKLSRSRATKFRTRHEHRAADNGGDAHAVASMADHQGRFMVFSQAFRQIDSRDPAALCVGPNDEGCLPRDNGTVRHRWLAKSTIRVPTGAPSLDGVLEALGERDVGLGGPYRGHHGVAHE